MRYFIDPSPCSVASTAARRLVGPLALVLLLASPPARAAVDLQGTRSIAMGGGLRASATGESAVLLNPAGMSLIKTYVISALYQFRVSDKASLLNVSVVDSVTNQVSAGLFYSFRRANPSRVLGLGNGMTFDLAETHQSHEAGLALAYPLFNILHLGASVRYVYESVEQPENTPEFAKLEGNNGVTVDVGAILRPFGALNIAVIGYNLVPLEGDAFPIQLGLGLSYTFGSRFLVEFDSVLDFERGDGVAASFHGGAEVFVADLVALRGGGMYDMVREAAYVTGGLGLITKKVGIDVGLRQMVEGGPETLLAFSVRLFLQ